MAEEATAVAAMVCPAPEVKGSLAMHAVRAQLIRKPRLLRVPGVGRLKRRVRELVHPEGARVLAVGAAESAAERRTVPAPIKALQPVDGPERLRLQVRPLACRSWLLLRHHQAPRAPRHQ